MPGKLREDIEEQGVIWRPIMAGMVSLGEVERGDVPLHRLMQLNGMLDMRDDLQRQAQKEAR